MQRTTLTLPVAMLRRYRAALLREAELPGLAKQTGTRYLAIAHGLKIAMGRTEDSGAVPVTTLPDNWAVLADVALQHGWYAEGLRFHQHARRSLFALPTEQVSDGVDATTMKAVRRAAATMELQPRE